MTEDGALDPRRVRIRIGKDWTIIEPKGNAMTHYCKRETCPGYEHPAGDPRHLCPKEDPECAECARSGLLEHTDGKAPLCPKCTDEKGRPVCHVHGECPHGYAGSILEWRRRLDVTREAIREHRDAKADDRCWMDDERLYEVLPEGLKADRRVGDQAAMLRNCERYVRCRTEGGRWPTYEDLERRIEEMSAELEFAADVFDDTCQCGSCGPCTRKGRMVDLVSQAREQGAGPSEEVVKLRALREAVDGAQDGIRTMAREGGPEKALDGTPCPCVNCRVARVIEALRVCPAPPGDRRYLHLTDGETGQETVHRGEAAVGAFFRTFGAPGFVPAGPVPPACGTASPRIPVVGFKVQVPVDVNGAEVVEFQADRHTAWVNVDGRCVLRVYAPQEGEGEERPTLRTAVDVAALAETWWLYVPDEDEAGVVIPGRSAGEALKNARKAGWSPGEREVYAYPLLADPEALGVTEREDDDDDED